MNIYRVSVVGLEVLNWYAKADTPEQAKQIARREVMKLAPKAKWRIVDVEFIKVAYQVQEN